MYTIHVQDFYNIVMCNVLCTQRSYVTAATMVTIATAKVTKNYC